MIFFKKFMSRRLVVLGAIFGAPVLYHAMGVGESITLAVTAAASAYILGRAYSDKKSGAE